MRAAIVLVLALGLAACGGEDRPAAKQVAAVSPTGTPVQAAPPQTAPAQPASPQATASTAPTTAPTSAPTDAPPATDTPTPDPEAAKSTPAPTATPLPKDAPTATPTPKPAKPKKNGPVVCLTSGGLKQAKKNGSGLWSASLGGPHNLVAVDGPYPSPRDAQLSVESLDGVSDAEVGGNYVVSASVASKAKATVHRVADCLDARDR